MNTNIIIAISDYVEKVIKQQPGYSLERAHRIFNTHITQVDQEYKRQLSMLQINERVTLEIQSGDFSKALKNLLYLRALTKEKVNEIQVAVKEDLAKEIPKQQAQLVMTKDQKLAVSQTKYWYQYRGFTENWRNLEMMRTMIDISKAAILRLDARINELAKSISMLNGTNRDEMLELQLKLIQSNELTLRTAKMDATYNLIKGVK